MTFATWRTIIGAVMPVQAHYTIVKVIRKIGFGILLLLFGFLMACATNAQVTGERQVNIGEITLSPAEYEGKMVTVSGEYRGWESGHGSPPVTRSDWILKDETGAIYVTGKVSPGLDPVDDRGKKITVSGVVKVKDGQAYIEAETIKK